MRLFKRWLIGLSRRPAFGDRTRKRAGNDDWALEAVNDASRHASAIGLTFLATTAYIAISSASISDVGLFLNQPLTLPLFNAGVAVRSFSWLAPILLLVLHIYLLLGENVVAYRIAQIPATRLTEIDTAGRVAVAPSVVMRIPGKQRALIGYLWYGTFIVITVALPVLVLIVIQAKFLPLHDQWLTNFHRAVVGLDIGVLWFFLLMKPRPAFSAQSIGTQQVVAPVLTAVLGLIVSGVVIWCICYVLVVSGECKERNEMPWYFGHSNLSLRDKELALREPAETRRLLPATRDLRCADFTGSRLVGADFRGANLTGASFVDAVLVAAEFSPREGRERLASLWRVERNSREGSHDMQGVDEGPFITIVRNANFTRAELRNARMRYADLSGAEFDYADLSGADLSFSRLDGARLPGSQLVAADLRSSSLRATSFQGASLQAANLRLAIGEFVDFRGADLLGVDFTGASFAGGEFQDSGLEGSIGLDVALLDLRRAKLGQASFCEKRISWTLADMRYIEKGRDSDEFASEIDPSKLSNEARRQLKRQLERAKAAVTCFGDQNPIGRTIPSGLLYRRPIDGKPIVDWPDIGLANDEYYRSRAQELLALSCRKGPKTYEALLLSLRRRLIDDGRERSGLILKGALEDDLRKEICSLSKENSERAAEIVWMLGQGRIEGDSMLAGQ